MKLNRLMAALTFVAAGVGAASAVAAVDPALPNYEKTSGVSGNLSSVGSDSLANLMTLWAEEFKRSYPNVNIQIQAAGSSTAPPALTEGTANMGPMSRPMKDNEIQAFEEKYGYKPTAVPVAIDALAVFVHKDNPIKSLDIEQVDGIFSSTLNAIGYSGIGYKTSSVRAVPLSKGGEAFEASEENALAGKFPLARFFYVYVNKAPNKPLSPLDAEFIKLVMSKQGQDVVVKDGYIPLPKKVVDKTMQELGL